MSGVLEDNNENEVLDEVLEAVNKVLPAKSKHSYEKEYTIFCEWRKRKHAKGVDKRIILADISKRSINVS